MRLFVPVGLSLLTCSLVVAQPAKKPYPDTKSPNRLMGREGHVYFANAAQHPFQPQAQATRQRRKFWLHSSQHVALSITQARSKPKVTHSKACSAP